MGNTTLFVAGAILGMVAGLGLGAWIMLWAERTGRIEILQKIK